MAIVGGAVLGVTRAASSVSRAMGVESRRPLEEAERRVLGEVFEGGLDLDRVRVSIGGLVPVLGLKNEPLGEPRAVGEAIFWPRAGRYADIGGSWAVFVHEATHVAQYLASGPGYIADSLYRQTRSLLESGDRRGPYDWARAAAAGVEWGALGAEAQAALIQDLFEVGLHRDPARHLLIGGVDRTEYARRALAEARARRYR
jgi:hypothetical protein